MKIKGLEFGAGCPVVCVPVIEKSKENILAVLKAMTARNVNMIEWRMDWYEDIEEEERVQGLLEEISSCIDLSHTVFLCTFRSRQQGGEREIPEEQYLALNRLAAQSGVPDLVDLEYYQVKEPEHVLRQLKQEGVRVVCSNHDFQRTPSREELKRQLTDMVEAGADFAKLAVMPEHKTDVLHLMEAVLAVKEQYPDSHLIAMSMGGDGVISRLLGGWYESEVTFAAFEKASAPGQIAYDRLTKLLEQLEECMK